MPPLGAAFVALRVLDWKSGQSESCGQGLGTQRAGLKKIQFQKGKVDSTTTGKTLSPGRELLQRVPFKGRRRGTLSDNEPGSQSRLVLSAQS